jgi:hypothetical protein
MHVRLMGSTHVLCFNPPEQVRLSQHLKDRYQYMYTLPLQLSGLGTQGTHTAITALYSLIMESFQFSPVHKTIVSTK